MEERDTKVASRQPKKAYFKHAGVGSAKPDARAVAIHRIQWPAYAGDRVAAPTLTGLSQMSCSEGLPAV